MNIDRLNQFEKDTLLRAFLHFIPMGQGDNAEPTKFTRTQIMRQYPAIYNKLADLEIVTVMHVTSQMPA